MNYAICTVAAAPVRKEDSHRSEMINQLLFGEPMLMLETKDEWIRIQSLYDNYEGWLTSHLVTPVEKKTVRTASPFVATALVNPVTLPDELLNVPMGASLTGLDEETRLLWDGQHRYHGTYRDVTEPLDIDLLWRSVQAWINAPYLWGGRTFMGVDCSGFVQVVYKVLGIALRRDAWQQAEQGEPVGSLHEARVGDIAFFYNREGRVIHVGILLGDGQIAHASGKVRIDRIDAEGITNVSTGMRSHQLHSIRRFIA
jgi:gamma-D-glutamyl-L-lysine dipeptidyl-peptidase